MGKTADQAPATEQSGNDTMQSAADAFEAYLGDEQEAEEGTDEVDESEQPAEGEDSPEADGDEVEGPDATEEQPAETHAVTIDGEESRVTLDELKNGYQRGADYTRKTQELANHRREFEAEASAVTQERARYSQLLAAVDGRLQELNPQPDWNALRQRDPIEFAAQWAHHQQVQQERGIILQEQQRVAGLQQLAAQGQLRAALMEEGKKLPTLIPAWKDQAVAKTEMGALKQYATETLGFDPEDVAGIQDSRAVAVLYKAWKYDSAAARIKSAKAAVPNSAGVKTLAPGQSSKINITASTKAKQRLAKTGSVKDAAAVFEHSFA